MSMTSFSEGSQAHTTQLTTKCKHITTPLPPPMERFNQGNIYRSGRYQYQGSGPDTRSEVGEKALSLMLIDDILSDIRGYMGADINAHNNINE